MKKPSIINKMLGFVGLKIINAAHLNSEAGWRQIIGGFFKNLAKQIINNDTALTVATVFACIRNVSEDTGKLPLKIYQKTGRVKTEQPEHPLYNLLQFRPNPEMTAIAFREALTAHMMGWGNAFAEIERDIYGKIAALWLIRPDRVAIYRDINKKLFYRVSTETGSFIDLWPKEILHLHGLGYDGVAGYNVIQYARESIAVSMASEKMASAFFGNGCHFGGNIKHPNNLSKEAQERLRDQIEKENQGVDKAARLLVLEEGMEFVKTVIDPKEAQFLETRQFSVPEICRWFRVPPHKVADLTKSAFSNIEQQNIDYVTDGLMGWCIRWEEELWYKLLTPEEQKSGFYFKHLIAGLMRGDIKARTEAYKSRFDMASLSPNDIREMEDENPIEGGDRYFVQLNLVPLDKAGENTGQTAIVKPAGKKKKDTQNAIINDIAERISNAEIREIEKHIKFAEHEPEKFKNWLNEFYEKHNAYIAKTIAPLGDVSINIWSLSMKSLLENSSSPAKTFETAKITHCEIIKINLRDVYGNK